MLLKVVFAFFKNNIYRCTNTFRKIKLTSVFFFFSFRLTWPGKSCSDSLCTLKARNRPFQDSQQVRYWTSFLRWATMLYIFSWSNVVLFFSSVFIDDFLATGRGEAGQDPQLEFEQLPFSHPLFIMYSSGTTGAPKCMVHSAGVRQSQWPNGK